MKEELITFRVLELEILFFCFTSSKYILFITDLCIDLLKSRRLEIIEIIIGKMFWY